MACRIKCLGNHQPFLSRSYSLPHRGYSDIRSKESNAALERRVRAFTQASPPPGVSSFSLKKLEHCARHNIPSVPPHFLTMSQKDVTHFQQAESKAMRQSKPVEVRKKTEATERETMAQQKDLYQEAEVILSELGLLKKNSELLESKVRELLTRMETIR